VLERRRLRDASINGNFANDPLITLDPTGDTSLENALNMQNVLNMNFKATLFRDRTFRKINSNLARYGSAVVYTDFSASRRPIRKTKIVNGLAERVEEEEVRHNSNNFSLDIRNYFQNPAIPDSWASDYSGHLQSWELSDFIDRSVNSPEDYIKENLELIIKRAKQDNIKDPNIKNPTATENKSKSMVVTHMFTKMNISGNEDDQRIYYLEIAQDKIIRFQLNPYDLDIVPYSYI